MTRLDFTGKVAIVTGASRGIGEAIATAFAGAGAVVVAIGRVQAPLDAVCAAIERAGGRARRWCRRSPSATGASTSSSTTRARASDSRRGR